MRSWYPILPTELDDKRLLGEHNELLIIGKAIYAIKHDLKYGFKNHPECKRWLRYTPALMARHNDIAIEMVKRGFKHKSPFPLELVDVADGDDYPSTIEPEVDMRRKLKEKIVI